MRKHPLCPRDMSLVSEARTSDEKRKAYLALLKQAKTDKDNLMVVSLRQSASKDGVPLPIYP